MRVGAGTSLALRSANTRSKGAPLMTTGMKALLKAQNTQSVEDKEAAREDKQSAIASQKNAIDDIHAQRTKKAEEDAQAIRDKYLGSLLGSIFLGPIIGG